MMLSVMTVWRLISLEKTIDIIHRLTKLIEKDKAFEVIGFNSLNKSILFSFQDSYFRISFEYDPKITMMHANSVYCDTYYDPVTKQSFVDPEKTRNVRDEEIWQLDYAALKMYMMTQPVCPTCKKPYRWVEKPGFKAIISRPDVVTNGFWEEHCDNVNCLSNIMNDENL